MLLPLAIDAQSLSCQEFRQERFLCRNCSGYSPHVYNELHATSRSRWSRNTPGQGNRIALTCSKNALDAESVSCTENTFKQHEWNRHTARVQLCRAGSSRHKQCHRCVRFLASCFHHRRTSHISTSSVQLRLLEGTSGFCTCQCVQDSVVDRFLHRPGFQRELVVQLFDKSSKGFTSI